MSNKMLRFFLVEHISLIVIAVVIATIGYSLAKKADIDSIKHRRVMIFFSISLLLILLAIPWPWQNYASGWY
jgi:membrane protein DedA with SNARE-associated domain